MDSGRFYASAEWRTLRQVAVERDRGRCSVARLLGGACSSGLHVHHIVPVDDAPEMALDLDNLATVCAAHHAAWEGLRRQLEVRRWRRCPHRHTSMHARKECERRLNAVLATG